MSPDFDLDGLNEHLHMDAKGEWSVNSKLHMKINVNKEIDSDNIKSRKSYPTTSILKSKNNIGTYRYRCINIYPFYPIIQQISSS